MGSPPAIAARHGAGGGLVEPLDRAQRVPAVRRPLELFVLGGPLHRLPERLREHPRLAAEKPLDRLDVVRVGRLADLARTGRRTEPQVVVETGPLAAGELVLGTAP